MNASIVLPCFNPPPGWDETVCEYFQHFDAAAGGQNELIVVIDGVSQNVTDLHTDRIRALSPCVTIIRNDVNMGKGYALRTGIAAATGAYIIYTDIDFPYTLGSLIRVYEGLKLNQFDIGIGIKDDAYYAHLPPLRRYISKTLQVLIRWFLTMPITDTQCGLKGFRSSVKPLFLATTINRYLFDLEFVKSAFDAGNYVVQPVPLQLRSDIQFRKMNYKILLPELWNFIGILSRRK